MKIIFKASFVIGLLLVNKVVYARDLSWVHFVKSYVANEEKPTSLILSDLCWGKSKLQNILSHGLILRTDLIFFCFNHISRCNCESCERNIEDWRQIVKRNGHRF